MTASSSLHTVACLGTGAMGHGVAFLCAKAGNAVRLFGRTDESLAKGLEGIRKACALYERYGLPMPAGGTKTILERVQGFTDAGEAAHGADFVMESVAESLAVKHAVFAEAEARCPEHAILATNTSSLSVSAVSAGLRRPERFVAVHFFNPPYLMPTVEVCPGPSTAPGVKEAAAAWVTSLGNMPIVLEKEVRGFLINRIQMACLREALYMVEQGWASAETVDRAIVHSLGRRYAVTGPIESAELGGLDVFNTVLDQLCPVLGKAEQASPLIKNAVAQGRFGAKTGGGLFDWPDERVAERMGKREAHLAARMKDTGE